MNKTLVCCAVLTMTFLAVARAADDDAVKKELETFSGTWKCTSATIDGKELSKEDAAKITLTVKGGKYTFKGAGETAEGTHTLDPSKKPKELDAVRTSGKEKGEKMLAIYELTKDSYKICLAASGKARPKEFSSKKDSGHRLMQFERAKE